MECAHQDQKLIELILHCFDDEKVKTMVIVVGYFKTAVTEG